MIAAERNQRQSGLQGRLEPAKTRGRFPTLLAVAMQALSFPLSFSVSVATMPYRRFWRGGATTGAPPQPPGPSEDEVFTERLENINSQARTLVYLLQSCIDQLDSLVHPRAKRDPLRQPRTMPAAGLRVVRSRHYHPGPITSRRGVPLSLAATMLAPLAVIAAGFGGLQLYNSYVHKVVPPTAMAINTPLQGAKIYDRNGTLLYQYIDDQQGVRIPVTLDDVSDAFLAATIATEDESFFTNPGVNPRGLARAAWENLSPYLGGESAALEGSGGSSITQQLVKNVYIPPAERSQRSIDRKVREAALAIDLTQSYDKDQILTWYVNQISYGGLYNGVEAASEGYFGKPAKDLTLAEAALLAGIPQSPAAYDPVNQPEAAAARRDQVLDLIAKQGRIQVGDGRYFEPSADDIAAARAEPVAVQTPSDPILAPHFVFNHVEPELEALFGKDAIERDGLIVTTTLDMNLQNQAQANLENWISQFEDISNSRNGAVLVIDNHTGEILALVGSRDYFRDDIAGNVDNIDALNSPGSTFKPFIYLTSFLKLGWTPTTIIQDTPVTYRESDGTIFQPQNPTIGSYMGAIPIKTALGNSLNVPAFKTALALGVPAIIDTAKRMGFTTLDGFYGPAIAIGGVDLNAMDLTFGYSVLANEGLMVGEQSVQQRGAGKRDVDPISILKVTDSRGNVLYNADDHRVQEQVVPPEQAYLVTSILDDPANECATFGCGGVAIPGRVAGVKTGTSSPYDPNGPNANKIGETWAFGYTPDYSVGVWAGNSDNAPVVNIFSTSISFRVMRDTMQAAYDGRPSGGFIRPAGIGERKVCNGPACTTELFVARTTDLSPVAAPPKPPAPPPPAVAAPPDAAPTQAPQQNSAEAASTPTTAGVNALTNPGALQLKPTPRP